MFELPQRDILLNYANALTREKFTPGIDGVTAARNLDYLLINGDAVAAMLAEGRYKPMPALAFAVVNKKGKVRELSRFSAIDMVVQRALAAELSAGLNGVFSVNSYAFIKGRGVHAAVSRFCEIAKDHNYAAKIDTRACFDNVDRGVLLHKLRQIVDNDAFVEIVRLFAECDIADEKGIHKRDCGILQGSPLSPVLCNIYFHELDMLLENKGVDFIRYADDTVVFADSFEKAKNLARLVADYLVNELKLEINGEKLQIASVEGLKYLGYVFVRDGNNGVIGIEEAAAGENNYAENWMANRFLKGQDKVNILSDGVLSRKETALLFENSEGKTLLPPAALQQLNVYSSVTFAPQVIKAAFDNGIRINIFNKFGELIGRFEPTTGYKNSAIVINQLEIYRRTRGLRMHYARDFLLSRNHNIRLNLRYQRKTYGNIKCADATEKLKAMEAEIKRCKTVDDLLIIEARIQKIYFSCFSEFIRNPEFEFKNRSRRPPRDAVNAMLSFGNTFLYNYIAVEINKTPLDIRIAYLHSTSKRTESLNLDIADVYKPLIVDRTVFALLNRHIITPRHFCTENNGGVYLTNVGKRLLISALNDKLENCITVGNERKSYAYIIHDEIRSLCSDVRELRCHKSFRQTR